MMKPSFFVLCLPLLLTSYFSQASMTTSYTISATHAHIYNRKTYRIEIREYPPLLIAQTQAPGDRKTAANQGFRQLASYIFGGNTTKTKIAMTAPVIQQALEHKEKHEKVWLIQFVYA